MVDDDDYDGGGDDVAVVVVVVVRAELQIQLLPDIVGESAARSLDKELLELAVIHLRVNVLSHSPDRNLYRKWCVSLEASNASHFYVLHVVGKLNGTEEKKNQIENKTNRQNNKQFNQKQNATKKSINIIGKKIGK